MSAASSSIANNFAKNFLCPVTKSLLTDAVNLHPCNHKISEIAAKTLKKQNQGANFKCPLCREVVQSHAPDPAIRSAAEHLFSKELQKNFSTVVSALSRGIYPGNSAVYKAQEEFWEVTQPIVDTISSKNIIRSIVFTTDTNNPFFRTIVILGFSDGSIAIELECVDGNLKPFFEKYLKILESQDAIAYYSDRNFIRITGNENLKRLCDNLNSNNKFPDTPLRIMQSVVEAGTWTRETPLKPKDIIYPGPSMTIDPMLQPVIYVDNNGSAHLFERVEKIANGDVTAPNLKIAAYNIKTSNPFFRNISLLLSDGTISAIALECYQKNSKVCSTFLNLFGLSENYDPATVYKITKKDDIKKLIDVFKIHDFFFSKENSLILKAMRAQFLQQRTEKHALTCSIVNQFLRLTFLA